MLTSCRELDYPLKATATLSLALTLLLIPLLAAADDAPDLPEPGSVEAIAAFTTDPRFVSPWVASVPEGHAVPSPTDYLGRIAGATGEMTGPVEIFGYFRALAEASPRVQVEEIGRTEEGREILLVVVTDEEGIRTLAELKNATAELADPRRTDPQRAEEIIAHARPIYYINAGLHADETGPPEAVMELAYRLAVSEEPMIRRIRERVVVLINPIANPDGRAKMTDWFYRYLKGRTDYDELPRQSPPYWGRYVFVDMNRDAHQQTQAETEAIYRMFWDFHPTVIHDLHESFALLQTWNGTGPYNPNLDPIVTSAFLEMSFHEVTRMTALGMPGVWTWDFGDGYGHHYADSVAMNHNAIGRGYETMGNATAETVERVLDHGRNQQEPGFGHGRRRARSIGRCATASTTPRPGCSPSSTTPPATPPTCCATSTEPASIRGRRALPGPLRLRHPQRPGGSAPHGADGQPAAAPGHRGLTVDGTPFTSTKAFSPPAALSSGSTSPTATTPSTSSSRRTSSSPPASCPTTTCRGRCRCTTASRPSASTTVGSSMWPSSRSRARLRRPAGSRNGPVFLIADTGQEALPRSPLPTAELLGADRRGGLHLSGGGLPRRQLDPTASDWARRLPGGCGDGPRPRHR